MAHGAIFHSPVMVLGWAEVCAGRGAAATTPTSLQAAAVGLLTRPLPGGGPSVAGIPRVTIFFTVPPPTPLTCQQQASSRGHNAILIVCDA